MFHLIFYNSLTYFHFEYICIVNWEWILNLINIMSVPINLLPFFFKSKYNFIVDPKTECY